MRRPRRNKLMRLPRPPKTRHNRSSSFIAGQPTHPEARSHNSARSLTIASLFTSTASPSLRSLCILPRTSPVYSSKLPLIQPKPTISAHPRLHSSVLVCIRTSFRRLAIFQPPLYCYKRDRTPNRASIENRRHQLLSSTHDPLNVRMHARPKGGVAGANNNIRQSR
jgi:hypothetical protein